MEFLLDHTNYLSSFSTDYFYVKTFALDHSVSLFFCRANTKLAPKQWIIIVIENIANSRSRIDSFYPTLKFD